MKKVVLLAFVLVLLSMPMFGRFTRPVEASGTITIKADGSIEGTTHISTVDNVTYTFTDNIFNQSIVVERDNIVIDGASYTLEGTGACGTQGIDLSYRSNVTLKNVEVTNFHYGIYLSSSSNNIITGNNASNNYRGIYLDFSYNNTVSNNTVCSNGAGIYNGAGIFIGSSSNNNVLTGNTAIDNENGIRLWESGNNVLTGNTVSNNTYGIYLDFSSNNNFTGNIISKNQYNFHVSGGVLSDFVNYVDTSNTVDGKPIYYLIEEANVIIDAKTNAGTIYLIKCNNITIRDLTLTKNVVGAVFLNTTNSEIENVTATNSQFGIGLVYSSNNTLFHNNLINNANQTYIIESFNNTWDNGYPSGGNYWSDYYGLDMYSGTYQNVSGSDFIGDLPYVLDANNNDHYPLMIPVARLLSRYDCIFRVVGDSMAPTILEKDLVGVKNTTEASEIFVGPYPYGDLIVHRDLYNPNIFIIRRAISKWYENGTWYFTVKSDNRSNTVDVTIDLIIGKIVSLVRSFDVTLENATFHPVIITNSTLGSTIFDASTRQFSVIITGFLSYGTTSCSEVFIPRGIFNTITDVKVNNISIPFSKVDYGAVKFIRFQTDQALYTAGIIGEFTSAYAFRVTTENGTFNISVNTPSVISNFTFDRDNRVISFNVEGFLGTTGFCNLTIPISFMGGPYTVKIDDVTVLEDYDAPTNGTHAIIYFTYNHSIHKVEIVPEFPTWTSMLLMLITLTVAIAICKRRLLKTPIH